MNTLVVVQSPAILAATLLLLPSSLSLETRDTHAIHAVRFIGTVRGAGNTPVAGATVRIMPWNVSSLTDTRGQYAVSVTAAQRGNAATITVLAQGYQPDVHRVRISGDESAQAAEIPPYEEQTVARHVVRLSMIEGVGPPPSSTGGDLVHYGR